MSLATNGTRIDDHWLKELKKAGLNSILFNIQSLDSRDSIVPDAGNLEKIKAAIPLARKAGLNVCINTCLGSYNIGPQFCTNKSRIYMRETDRQALVIYLPS